jgi:hypothetical protein
LRQEYKTAATTTIDEFTSMGTRQPPVFDQKTLLPELDSRRESAHTRSCGCEKITTARSNRVVRPCSWFECDRCTKTDRIIGQYGRLLGILNVRERLRLQPVDTLDVSNDQSLEVCFRPKALVIGRVSTDLAPSRIDTHIQVGEHHDLLCRTRRFTANRQHLCHR